MAFLDTDVVIDLLRGYQPAIDWLESLGDSAAPSLPGYVVLELLSYDGIKNKQDLENLEQAIGEFYVFWPSQSACEQAVYDVYHKRLSHTLLPDDAWIGNCAKERGVTLYSCHLKHLRQIEGLEVICPYEK